MACVLFHLTNIWSSIVCWLLLFQALRYSSEQKILNSLHEVYRQKISKIKNANT